MNKPQRGPTGAGGSNGLPHHPHRRQHNKPDKTDRPSRGNALNDARIAWCLFQSGLYRSWASVRAIKSQRDVIARYDAQGLMTLTAEAMRRLAEQSV
ncbi:MAG: hypothetical protein GC164_08960 [Phycisphaera sp.]|nr:hypothetical protein [Phycisphaera sp.]